MSQEGFPHGISFCNLGPVESRIQTNGQAVVLPQNLGQSQEGLRRIAHECKFFVQVLMLLLISVWGAINGDPTWLAHDNVITIRGHLGGRPRHSNP